MSVILTIFFGLVATSLSNLVSTSSSPPSNWPRGSYQAILSLLTLVITSLHLTFVDLDKILLAYNKNNKNYQPKIVGTTVVELMQTYYTVDIV